MRVLIISHACATPANQRLFQIAAERRRWDVSMVLPRRWKSEYGRVLTPARLDGFAATVQTPAVLASGSVPLHVYACRMGKLLKSIQPDVIYVHNEPYALSTAQCVMANQMTVSRPIGFYSAQNINKRYPIGFRQAERWVHRRSHFALPITGAVETVLRNKGYSNASIVVSVGYDGNAFRCEPHEARARHLNASGKPRRIGYIGRFVEEKGLATLFEAVALLQSNVILRLIGGGPMETQLREMAKSFSIENRIEWAGFASQSEMPNAYQSIDALVLPSETRPNWKEQFGRVLVEAMASGTPVIGSDSGEIPNVINECGGGVVFPEGNAIALASAIDQLCHEHERRADLAARGCVGARVHAWDHVADQFANALESAANRTFEMRAAHA